MLAKAGELGCSNADAACLCRNANFGYGVRDCSYQACGAEIGGQTVAFGAKYCKDAGVDVGGAGAGAGGSGSSDTTVVTSPSATVTETATDVSCKLFLAYTEWY